MWGKRHHRTHDRTFKHEAIRLAIEAGRSAAEVERTPGTRARA
jgi:hypothetical protein